MRKGKLRRTFTFVTVYLFLGVCSFAARVIKGKEVEREVTKFELYSREINRRLGESDIKRKI
jgi:hypothetical protein